MRNRNSALGATVVSLAVLAGIGAFKLYQRGRALEGDLVITGRTPVIAAKLPSKPVPSYFPPSSHAPTAPDNNDNTYASPKPQSEVVIHVAGAVRSPGLYHLPIGARIDDALKAAGSAKADANLDAVNLAAHVEDGTQLYVPTKTEQPAGGAPAASSGASSIRGTGSHTGATTSHNSGHAGKLTSPGQGTVNINTASAEDLEKLPGVGPSYAARIIEFRKTNGPFTNPEQLMDVSGIGEKKFDKMRPFVRIR